MEYTESNRPNTGIKRIKRVEKEARPVLMALINIRIKKIDCGYNIPEFHGTRCMKYCLWVYEN